MKRPVLAGLLIASAAALAVLFLVMRSAVQQSVETGTQALRNITVNLDGAPVTLQDGVATEPAALGSATQSTVRIVGEPVMGDATGDGKTDAALLIESDPGGSGTFYYAVLAVDTNGTYQATNAVALGDRIDPQDVEFTGGRFVYRFLERKPDEPMAAAPSVEKRVEITVDPASNRISAGN